MKTNCLIEILEQKGYIEVKKCESKDSTGKAGHFVEKYLAIQTKFESVYNKIVEIASNDKNTLLEQHQKSGRTFYIFVYQNKEAYNYIAHRTFIMNSVISNNGLDKLNKIVEPKYIIEPYSKYQYKVIDVVAEKKKLEKEMMEKEFEEKVNKFIDSLP